jgi:hypothetical protein
VGHENSIRPAFRSFLEFLSGTLIGSYAGLETAVQGHQSWVGRSFRAPQHGDARVPAVIKTEDGYKIWAWVSKQRGAYSRSRTLSAERVARLESLSGWVWDAHEAAWEEGFALLEQYVEAHGDTRVPQAFKAKRTVTERFQSR